MDKRVAEIREKAERTLRVVEKMMENIIKNNRDTEDLVDLQAERRILIEIIEDFEYIQTGVKKEQIIC